MKTTLLFLSVFLSANLFGQNVYIPDANFKAYLVGNPSINTNGDDEIQVSEASTYSTYIECDGWNISDLTGIEAFTAITVIVCDNNQLTSLDLSSNTALTKLVCSNNGLTSLNVSQNTALTALVCSNNGLTSLDVSHNTALDTLSCGNNQLTSLDVSQNTALTDFTCRRNQLTSLNVSQNTALTALGCSYNGLTSLDVSQNIAFQKLFCNENQLTSLDLSQNNALYYLNCEQNQLTCLNVANGNNTDMPYFNANFNLLTCIEVDDATWSSENWILIDSQTSFSENCDYPSSCFTSSLTELTTSKNLIQILDVLGRETTFQPNIPLIYVYDDGTIEKVFRVEY